MKITILIGRILAGLMPTAVINGIKAVRIRTSLEYYKKIFQKQCKSCGSNVRIYSPYSIKGLRYVTVGDNVKVGNGCSLEAWDLHNDKSFQPSIVLGDNVSIGKNCHIGAINEVIIEDNVLTGSDILIIDHAHGMSTVDDVKISPNERLLFSKGKIHIKKNVWIGDKVVILPNVIIGENSIIGAGSIVTKNVPANSVVCGNPARVVKIIQ